MNLLYFVVKCFKCSYRAMLRVERGDRGQQLKEGEYTEGNTAGD